MGWFFREKFIRCSRSKTWSSLDFLVGSSERRPSTCFAGKTEFWVCMKNVAEPEVRSFVLLKSGPGLCLWWHALVTGIIIVTRLTQRTDLCWSTWCGDLHTHQHVHVLCVAFCVCTAPQEGGLVTLLTMAAQKSEQHQWARQHVLGNVTGSHLRTAGN